LNKGKYNLIKDKTMAKIQTVRGTYDVYGDKKRAHNEIIKKASKVAISFGFEEIETPIFEFTNVFARNLGETSDVVTKEMYNLEDRGGESLTLRPEGTAGVVRSFVSEGMQQNLPVKLFYHGPMFRYERPQKGRQRQFTQFGAELLGVETPQADIEVIAMAYNFINYLDLGGNVIVEVNSLGDEESRDAYRKALVEFLKANVDGLSEDSKNRLEKNPLRVLDSKEECDKEIVKNAPLYRDYLNEESKNFFEEVLNGLNELGIKYELNDRLVRGLDYYNHTVFEITTDCLGSQGTVLAGGRYNGLVKQMGGADVPGIGWACGVERLAMMLKEPVTKPTPVVVIPTGSDVNMYAVKIAYDLRTAGIVVEQAYSGNMKKRMQKANKLGAKYAVIIGSDEVANQVVTLKDLQNNEQKEVAISDLVKEVK
jgi:histidyl-tRNA synthetase